MIFPATKKFFHFWQQVICQFHQDGCLNRAASLSYVTLLSLVPLLTVSFSVLRAFPVFQGLAQQMQNFIFKNFVTEAAQTVQQHLQSFVMQTEKLPVLGMLFLLATAVLLIFSIEQAFNDIWRVKKRRSQLSAFLLYWGVITFVPILIGIGLTLSAYVLNLPIVSDVGIIIALKQIVLIITPYLLTYLAFALLYVALPNCVVPLRHAFLAALPAAILFELAKLGFTFYITHFPTYKLIYGALATIPIFLIWLYVTWNIILFGAVINYVLTSKASASVSLEKK